MPRNPASSALAAALGALALAATLAASGCGHAKMTDAQAGVPDKSPAAANAREAALREGIEAMRRFRQESFKPAENPGSQIVPLAGYRNNLTAAIGKLRPAPGRPAAAEYESATQALEMALAAMNDILSARSVKNEDSEERGWALFNAAAMSLAETLAPRNRPPAAAPKTAP